MNTPAAPALADVAPARLGARCILGVGGLSLALGAATSWAQAELSHAWAPLANSPSGWAAVTAVVVMACRPGLPRGAGLGAVSFVCLVLGYTLGAELRGLSYHPIRWGVIGVLTGPFVGMAAAAVVSRRTARVAVGSGVLAGVLVADGIYGLTVVLDTTSPVYWTTALVVGLLLVAVTAGTRLRTPSSIRPATRHAPSHDRRAQPRLLVAQLPPGDRLPGPA